MKDDKKLQKYSTFTFHKSCVGQGEFHSRKKSIAADKEGNPLTTINNHQLIFPHSQCA
jgi:hypothetical protein